MNLYCGKIAFGWLLAVTVLALFPASAGAWETLTSEEGGFEVEVPGEPFSMTNKMPTASGEIDVTFYLVPLEEVAGVVFFVGYAEYPESDDFDAAAEMDAAITQFIEAGNAEVNVEREFEIEGGIGRELETTGEDGVDAHLRVCVVNRRIYFLAVSLPEGASAETESTRFFDSFEVQASAAAP